MNNRPYSFGLTNREVVIGFRKMLDSTLRTSHTSRWTTRLLLYYLKTIRSRILYEKRSQPDQISNQFNKMIIPCVSLQKADQNECPCAPPSNLFFLRSTHPIPRPINGKYEFVASILGNIDYTYVAWHEFKNTRYSRIAAERNTHYYTLKNIGNSYHIYILNDLDKTEISIGLVPEDPMDIQNYPNCNQDLEDICNPLDQEFFIDREFLTNLYQLTFEKLISMNNSVLGDVLNNSNDDSTPNTINSAMSNPSKQ
jgi:hypothetical protein